MILQVLLIKKKKNTKQKNPQKNQPKKPQGTKNPLKHNTLEMEMPLSNGNTNSKRQSRQCRIAQLHRIIMNFFIQTLLKTGEIREALHNKNTGDDHCASQEHKSFQPKEQSNSMLLILHLKL